MTKYQAIRRMIEKECQRISLTDLCEHWDVTCEDFYEFLDAARPNEEMDDREEIKELDQSQGGWISVKDKMPPECRAVIAYRPDKSAVSVYDEIILDVWISEIDGWLESGMKSITHWMPLPEPPKGVEGE